VMNMVKGCPTPHLQTGARTDRSLAMLPYTDVSRAQAPMAAECFTWKHPELVEKSSLLILCIDYHTETDAASC
jgi:hypothetical protein